MRFTTLLAASVGLAALSCGGAAFAQDAQPSAQDGSTDLGEIIVTARKREERLQDVPIAVTATSGETLEREQINLVKDVAALTPGLNISSDAVGRAFLAIRGVGNTLIDTVQPGVGIFIDGIYQPNTSYLNSPVVDVERIEVLRGPQGTLFGNNTLGGAINVVTRAPTDTPEGRFTASVAGPDDYRTFAGSISGPIVPGSLRGRIAANYHSHDGFSENLLVGGDARPLETKAINGSLLWDADDSAQIQLNAYWNQVTGSQTAYASPSGPTDYVDDVPLNANSIAQYDYTGVNVRGVFDITSNTQMTVIGAYDAKDGKASGDGDFGPVPLLLVTDGRNARDTITGEVRFDTAWNDRLSTLVGVFANKSDSTDTISRTTDLGLLLGMPAGTLVIPSTTVQGTGLDSQAAYANVFYDLADDLELSAGIRFDHQDVTATNTVGTYTADEWQPRVTIRKKWNDQHSSYASISRGFRGGGANPPGAPNPFWEGDSVWTYEIGDKFTNADRTLTLNTAIYYNDYKNYIGQNALTPTLIAVNLNTGDVESYGIEAEAIWTPNEIFQIRAGGTYNHARITDDTPFENVIGYGLPSDRILFQPDFNGFVSANATFPVANGEIRTDVTATYKGERVGSTLSPTVFPTLEGYTLVNANVAYNWGNHSVALFATNLFDERYYDSYLDQSLLAAFGFSGPLVHELGITGDRRRVGVRLSTRF